MSHYAGASRRPALRIGVANPDHRRPGFTGGVMWRPLTFRVRQLGEGENVSELPVGDRRRSVHALARGAALGPTRTVTGISISPSSRCSNSRSRIPCSTPPSEPVSTCSQTAARRPRPKIS